MTVKVELLFQGESERAGAPVRALVKAVMHAEQADGAVTVVFTDESEMKELNRRFRGLDEPTDVLSFRQADSDLGWPGPTAGADADLGEMVVCPAVVDRYAQEEDGDPDTQLGWTILHGVLHLLGYDHEKDEGEMRAREQALLATLAGQVRAVSIAHGG